MDLRTLILMEKDSRGLTYSELEDACGGKPTAARLQQMATPNALKEFPDPNSVRGLSRGLRKTELSIVLSAAESLGLDVKSQAQLADLLPPESGALTDVQIAAVQQTVWAMLHPHGAVDDQSDADTAEIVKLAPGEDMVPSSSSDLVSRILATRSRSHEAKLDLIVELFQGLPFREAAGQIAALDIPAETKRDLITRLPIEQATGT